MCGTCIQCVCVHACAGHAFPMSACILGVYCGMHTTCIHEHVWRLGATFVESVLSFCLLCRLQELTSGCQVGGGANTFYLLSYFTPSFVFLKISFNLLMLYYTCVPLLDNS